MKFRERLYEIIFKADTRAGRLFNVVLLTIIFISVLLVMLESVSGTGLGQFLASIVMIMGYSIIAVPTGIITAAIIRRKPQTNTQICSKCMLDRHEDDARYCKRCGNRLE